jgi:GNAT superfamily N-acetyltransferase
MTTSTTIIVATDGDMPFVDHVQWKHAESVSFIPRAGVERAIAARQIMLAFVDGEPVGYLWRSALAPAVSIVQAAIEFEAQRRHYGAALVAHVVGECEAAGANSLSCRCGSALEANGFWRSVGFVCVATMRGGGRRGRVLNVWHRQITPGLFATEPVEPFVGTLPKIHGSGRSSFSRPKGRILTVGGSDTENT